MYAHQPLGPPPASGVPDMAESTTVHSICTCIYALLPRPVGHLLIPMSDARGIRFPAYANYLVQGSVLHGESYQGLAPPRNTTKKRTSTINPNDRQSAKLTDQAQGTIENAADESRRTTPTQPCTPQAQKPLPSTTQTQQGYRQSPLSRFNPVLAAGRPDRTPTLTPPAPTGTRGPARHLEGPVIWRTWWTAMDARQAYMRGQGEKGRQKGEMNE